MQQPQAVLDLHGYFLAEAEETVDDFLEEARDKNYRFVRIITGKGEVLNPWLAEYLFARGINYQPARPNQGGEGAFDIIF